MDRAGIEVLRVQIQSDWADAVRWMRYFHEWPEQDIREFNAAIKQDIAAGEVGQVQGWAGWVSRLAGEMRAWSARVRAMEEEMRVMARQTRKAR